MLDAYPKGEIFLGHHMDGYSVRIGAPMGAKDQGFSFTLFTPERVYNMSAHSMQERDEWIKVIQKVLERPLTPQDSSSNYFFFFKLKFNFDNFYSFSFCEIDS